MRRLHILVVDHDPNARSKLQTLPGADFIIHCVGSIAEAKVCLESATPDILISEVVVGQESGLDLCQYVRSTSSLRFLPIMLLTSRATLHDKVAGFNAGTDDYVVKPFDARHLVARIRVLSRIKRLEQHPGY